VDCAGDRPDDAGLHAAVQGGRDGAEVTFDARLVADPVDSGGHERLRVEAATGERLEIDHNLRLAAEVPARAGDTVVIRGRLYIDASGPGVHCTHARTSRGCPEPGWIRFRGQAYQ
jgi:hypothetical protein